MKDSFIQAQIISMVKDVNRVRKLNHQPQRFVAKTVAEPLLPMEGSPERTNLSEAQALKAP